MITDPPYGVGYDPSWRARRGLGAGNLARGKVLNDDRGDWREAYALFPGDVAYIWHGALHGDIVAAGLAACGLHPRAQIVWAKQHLAGIGLRQDDIAKIIGCSPKTLRKRLRDELDRGVAEANATVSGYLFASAKAGNVTAQIF
jgi:hypothetical protein